mmetsp:Transcript_29208/g.53445  ORF Transcript_29208/g.53445 Transcript_29208/m.53445 type:complete len:99 (+) Transcript_29208:409-705(+)
MTSATAFVRESWVFALVPIRIRSACSSSSFSGSIATKWLSGLSTHCFFSFITGVFFFISFKLEVVTVFTDESMEAVQIFQTTVHSVGVKQEETLEQRC